MNKLIKALAEVCRRERFTEKRLVVDTYHSGYELLEALAESGEPWLNVTVVTPAGLAAEIAEEALADEGLQMADEGEINHLIDDLLAMMRKSGSLNYFAALDDSTGQVEILGGALTEMRLAGTKAAHVDPAFFVDRQKGEEIAGLLAGYKAALAAEKLADQAALYEKAEQLLAGAETKDDHFLYLIPEQLDFNYLSYRFLELLTRDKRIILPAEPVYGLQRPEGFYFEAGAQHQPGSPLTWLYDQAQAEARTTANLESLKSLEMFKAYSPACEVRELFRRFKAGEINADRALLCYTNGSLYLPLIKGTAESLAVPVTYGEGLPLLLTRPGRLVSGLLDWVSDNYSANHLYELFVKALIRMPWSKLQARLLRRAAVGWGRSRYDACFAALEEKIKDELEKAQARGQNIHYRSAELDQLKNLADLVNFLQANIPEADADGKVQYDQFCLGLAAIVAEKSRSHEEEDRLAREGLLLLLEREAKGDRSLIDLRLACNKLRSRCEALRTGAAVAKPGHLHVVSLKRAGWAMKPNTYVVGLSGSLFPGSGLQDAVLLDGERKKISRNLSMVAERPERNLYRLNRFLAERRGPVCLSFACYDPVAGRPAFPASVMLQAYRLKEGEPGADYSELLRSLYPPAAYYPGNNETNALTVYEWWLSLVLGGRKSGVVQSVAACYPGIRAGLAARDNRLCSSFTEYDGKVNVDRSLVDPRLNPKLSMSASSLEKLAKCPFQYFLERVLYISVPEDRLYDRWSWLNVMERGSLLHRIYAAYLQQVCCGRGTPQANPGLLTKIAEKEIEAWKLKTPPPSELVFRSEKNALLRELDIFLKCEEKLWQQGSIPLYMEAPFGRDAQAISAAGIGLKDPLELDLPGGRKVLLRGNIDRIDRLPQAGEYQVWDFKTGSTKAYRRDEYIKQGRQIQHALYAIAAEEILAQVDPGARVGKAGYIFPTEKGEGELYPRDQAGRDKALEAVDLMLDLIAGGTFCLTEKNNEVYCRYCDYQKACRFEEIKEALQEKIADPTNTALEPWKELQSYE